MKRLYYHGVFVVVGHWAFEVNDAMEGELLCAVLTPAGRGAVATVGVRGSGAVVAVGRRFRAASGKPLDEYVPESVAFGKFRTAGEADEELVIGLVGPQEVEVHCHGGIAAIAAVCRSLVAEGCRLTDAAEWVRGRHDDPLSAAALCMLSQTRTERAAAVLLDQYRGALRCNLLEIEGQLFTGDVSAASAALKALLARCDFGLHLTQPWRVVLAGQPNAGKSSLMNAIVGYERAIVFEQPGTTRDVLAASTAIEGWPMEFLDTAGIRVASDDLEAEAVELARAEAAAADAVLLVSDTTAAWDGELHAELAQEARRLLVVHNKCDLRAPPSDARPTGVAVSAKTGAGLDELCQALVALLVPEPPRPGAAIPFLEEQIAGLREAWQALQCGDLASARSELQLLLAHGRRL